MIAASGLHPLVLAFRDPRVLADLGDGEWQDLLDLARSNALSAKLAVVLSDRGLSAKILARAQILLEEDRIRALYNQNRIRFEVRQLTRALSRVKEPIVLLKGSAYLLAGLPIAYGRFMTDLDIMVPRHKLDAVEKALLHAGWVQLPTTDYDQRYYRE
ncbi:MAG TPA: nucleotidyltransferase family protein, partial [Nitrospira sp.]|nr:nucleotidyltransferase family protein [Nitrospira sp.]